MPFSNSIGRLRRTLLFHCCWIGSRLLFGHSWRRMDHAGSRYRFKQFLDLRCTLNKFMCPKIVAAVFDEFDKCNQESCNQKDNWLEFRIKFSRARFGRNSAVEEVGFEKNVSWFFFKTYPMDAVGWQWVFPTKLLWFVLGLIPDWLQRTNTTACMKSTVYASWDNAIGSWYSSRKGNVPLCPNRQLGFGKYPCVNYER